MTLKTLKDLDESMEKTEAFSHHAHLKQETIKWIKEATKKINEHSKEYNRTDLRFLFHEVDYNILELHTVIREKKHFFNITEEDLTQVFGMNVQVDKSLKKGEFKLK